MFPANCNKSVIYVFQLHLPILYTVRPGIRKYVHNVGLGLFNRSAHSAGPRFLANGLLVCGVVAYGLVCFFGLQVSAHVEFVGL